MLAWLVVFPLWLRRISNVLQRATLIESTQVHFLVNTTDDTTVAELPQNPLGPKVKLWLTLWVAGYKERIILEIITQQCVEITHIGIYHRFTPIVIFQQLSKKFHAVLQLLGTPAGMGLHVKQRNKILLFGLGHADEILKLLLNRWRSWQEMIASHFHTMLASILYVGTIAVLLMGSTLGCFNIYIFYWRILFKWRNKWKWESI